jgi:hypothetical protein
MADGGPAPERIEFLPMKRTLIGLGLTLAACGPSEEERARSAADSIVAIADSAGRVVGRGVDSDAFALMVHECKVYNLADAPNARGRRPVILEPDFYPFPTGCSRQSIESDSAWVTIVLGRMAFGAGGCCATGGTYRTRDGRTFEREGAGGKWVPVAADSAR